MTTREELLQQSCQHQTQALSPEEISAALAALPDWSVEHGKLVCTYGFKDYHATIAFVNAIAPVIHQEDHHPVLLVSYNRCIVRTNTHSVNGGLSQNDFICAAKFDDVFLTQFS